VIYFKISTSLRGEIKPKRVRDSFRLKLHQLASRWDASTVPLPVGYTAGTKQRCTWCSTTYG